MGEIAEDYSDYSNFDDDYDDQDEPRTAASCRYCGRPNLRWVDLGTNWRLYEGQKVHVCPIERKGKRENTMAKFKTFWILWQPGSSLPPTVRFVTKAAAQDAAEVMTSKLKVEFYVMRAEAVCQISEPPIKWSSAKEEKRGN